MKNLQKMKTLRFGKLFKVIKNDKELFLTIESHKGDIAIFNNSKMIATRVRSGRNGNTFKFNNEMFIVES